MLTHGKRGSWGWGGERGGCFIYRTSFMRSAAVLFLVLDSCISRWVVSTAPLTRRDAPSTTSVMWSLETRWNLVSKTHHNRSYHNTSHNITADHITNAITINTMKHCLYNTSQHMFPCDTREYIATHYKRLKCARILIEANFNTNFLAKIYICQCCSLEILFFPNTFTLNTVMMLWMEIK